MKVFKTKRSKKLRELKLKYDRAVEAIQILAEKPDEKCGYCKFKKEPCIDCSFVYDEEN